MGTLSDYWTRFVGGLRRVAWGEPDALPAAALRPMRVVLLTVGSFRDNRLGVHASGLAFYLLLSVVPLLAFLFLIFKLFRLPEMLRPFLLEMVTGGNAVLVERFTELIERSQSATLGGIGVLTLFVIGFLVLQRVKSTLNLIWQVKSGAGYGPRIIEYLVALSVIPVLLVATFTVSTFLASRRIGDVLSLWGFPGEMPVSLAVLSGAAIIALIVLYAYLFLPDTRVEWPAALLSALAAGATLRIAQTFYIRALLDLSNYNLVYGALVFLPLLMIWFYLGWVVFLLGAQLCCVIQNYSQFLERRRLPDGAATSAPFAGLLLLIVLLREFQRNGTAPTARAIAHSAALPKGAVEDGLRRLAEAELIARVEGKPPGYVPREPPETWSVGLVLRRLGVLPRLAEPSILLENAELTPLKVAFRKANRAMARPLDQLLLVELAGPGTTPVEQPPED